MPRLLSELQSSFLNALFETNESMGAVMRRLGISFRDYQRWCGQAEFRRAKKELLSALGSQRRVELHRGAAVASATVTECIFKKELPNDDERMARFLQRQVELAGKRPGRAAKAPGKDAGRKSLSRQDQKAERARWKQVVK